MDLGRRWNCLAQIVDPEKFVLSVSVLSDHSGDVTSAFGPELVSRKVDLPYSLVLLKPFADLRHPDTRPEVATPNRYDLQAPIDLE